MDLSQRLGIMGIHLIATNPHAIKLYLDSNFKQLFSVDYFIHISDVRQIFEVA